MPNLNELLSKYADRLGTLSVEDLVAKLIEGGASLPEHLVDVDESILKSYGVPEITARSMVREFSQQQPVVGAVTVNTFGAAPPLAGIGLTTETAHFASLEQLLEVYDFRQPNSLAATVLRQRADGVRFIVFTDQNTVDVANSVSLFNEVVNESLPERTSFGTPPRAVYGVGESPVNNLKDENPVARNVPLRADGTCSRSGALWGAVPVNVRQLLRVALDMGLIDAMNRDEEWDLCERAQAANAYDTLSQRYSSAAVALTQMAQPPVLKIQVTGPVKAQAPSQGANPFKTY